MIDENINLLKKHFPALRAKLDEMPEKLDHRLIKKVSSPAGAMNLLVNIKVKLHLHRQDDPLHEAQKIVEQHKDAENFSNVLFFGIGLGYHIDVFIDKCPNLPFSIYEPVAEVFYQWLCRVDLKQFPLHLLRDIFIESSPDEAEQYCDSYVRKIRDSALIIELPGYKRAFPEKHRHFFRHFEQNLKARRDHLNTILAFQKRWTINSMGNFKDVLNTPDIILEKKGAFRNIPALMLSAGPSLQDEIENIRFIKDHGLAYLFSAGTAIKTLLKHGIHPHAACTYDPSEKNQQVFAELVEKGINDIPLIFGSSVGFEMLKKYPGPKIHMLTGPDTISPYYLQPESGVDIEVINDAPSISVITLQLLYKLGFNPVILVGQDLTENKARVNEPMDKTRAGKDGIAVQDEHLLIEDVYGNKIVTDPGFSRVKAQIEMYLRSFQDLTVINSSCGGAAISGAAFMPLGEVIENFLARPVFEEKWLPGRKTAWKRNHLSARQQLMNEESARLEKLINKTRYMLKKISRTADNGNWEAIDSTYPVFNTVFARLRENSYFSKIILPMNQLPSEFLLQTIADLGKERDSYKKAKTLDQEISSFLDACENDIEMISALFAEMNQAIGEFLRQDLKARAAQIKVLLVECDGVLTDGGIYFDSEGRAARKFNHRDIQAMARLNLQGVKTILLAGFEDKMSNYIAASLGSGCLACPEMNGIPSIDELMVKKGWDYEVLAYVGIDERNHEIVKKAGLSCTVADAPEQVKEAVDYVSRLRGGEGVIRELLGLFSETGF